MLKQHKRTILLSCLVTLLPMAVGFVLWDMLPQVMTTHWNLSDTADGHAGKLFAVMGVPLILLAVQLLCIFFTLKDGSNKGQNKKVLSMILWIIPFVSLFSQGMIYAAAFGKPFEAMMLPCILMGLLFLLIGNYLPKCRQNRTIGIKLSWTLASEENWNATHRFGGKVWVVGGSAMVLCAFLPKTLLPWVMMGLLIVLIALPVLYSYVYHRRHPAEKAMPVNKKAIWITVILSLLTVLFLLILLFTGRIEAQFRDDKLYINATYWADTYLYYGDVEQVTLEESLDPGVRVNGFGSPKLSLGAYRNDALGAYLRYTYNSCNTCIIIVTQDTGTFVINAKDPQQTKALYDDLLKRLS